MGFFGGAVGAVAGLGEFIVGAHQANKWNKTLNGLLDNRPKYNVQDEYQTNTNLASNTRDMYGRLTNSSQLPGQAQMQLAQNSANATGSAAMYGVDNPAMLSQLAGNALNSQNQGTNKLNIAGAENRQSNIANFAKATDNLQDQNTAMAEEKDKAWNYNINQPYQNQVARAAGKVAQGQSTMYKGFDMNTAGTMEMADTAQSTFK